MSVNSGSAAAHSRIVAAMRRRLAGRAGGTREVGVCCSEPSDEPCKSKDIGVDNMTTLLERERLASTNVRVVHAKSFVMTE